jgi:hypothetical protein
MMISFVAVLQHKHPRQCPLLFNVQTAMFRVPKTAILTCLHRPGTRLLTTTKPAFSGYKATYNSVTVDDITHFSSILPKSSILSTLAPINTPAEDLDTYNNDWMTKYKGKSQCVLKPRSTQEVSDILKWCYERRIAVVPQGGNTGLVGMCKVLVSSYSFIYRDMLRFRRWRCSSPRRGRYKPRKHVQRPVFRPRIRYDSAIASLSHFTVVLIFPRLLGVLVADAGCILENLTNYLAPHKHIMPLDLGAKGRSVTHSYYHFSDSVSSSACTLHENVSRVVAK